MDKVCSMKEAISRYVHDGNLIYIGGWQGSVPYAAAHEIIRQEKKNMKLIAGASCEVGDHLVAAGCINEVYISWIGNDATKGSHAIRRAWQEGIPQKLTIHDFNNMGIVGMLLGGYYNLPFVPLMGMVGSDMIEHNSIIRFTYDPFSPDENIEVPVVPSIQPDVAILHVQRADGNGNSHRWGALSLDQLAGMAAKKVIITCEELVTSDLIRNDPNRTMIPGMKVAAVVHEPWGAHPSHMPGFYEADWDYRLNVSGEASKKFDSHEAFLTEWVYELEDRKAYLEHYVKLFGYERLEKLRLKEPILSASVNYGWR
ncbi:CoA transferase subunit A [Effusibacillus lacus]|uniref:3-oxoadipate--succinyl-CoA transferase n=1 Tax=Effusibacillus lacus TaxID=1348429 RepID=A0A292YHT0_9BACL|nr:CoA-transferase [Effusibacillus lacus]TCS74765.1 glutaconate CoA-transferase subunit A [Effusibacillus lacus]GAX88576.1 3-oxoadipate--succinyl-CoA transferase [Effusibacillus lacus]